MHRVLTPHAARALALSGLAFAALAATVLFWDTADRLDVRFVAWVRRSAPDDLVEIMRVVTYAGNGVVLAVAALVSAVLLRRSGRAQAALFVATATIGGLAATQLLKTAIRRARPVLEEPYVQLTTYAFPSGHALGATATYGALAIVAYLTMRASRGRDLVLAALVGTVAVVAASRVVLGAHYLLDVVAGVVAGVALLSGLVLAFDVVSRRVLVVGEAGRDEQSQRTGVHP